MRKILEVKNLSKYFGKFQALKDINFDIESGEIVGFIGSNGSGKSTTLKIIANFIFPSEGEIYIDGYSLKTHREKALENISCQIESPGLFYDLTGEENIKAVTSLYEVKEDDLKKAIAFINIGDNLKRKVKNYSMGMKQRLALALAIMVKPKLLILDEPTNGLDPTSVLKLREILYKLAKEEDISILFSSHQLGEVEKIADRTIFIKEGEIINFPELNKKNDFYYLTVNEIPKDYVEKWKIRNREDGKYEILFKDFDTLYNILTVLKEENISVLSLYEEAVTLEDVYKELY